MKGTLKKPTVTCEWINVSSVEDEKCLAQTEAEFLTVENLVNMFKWRANFLLQRTGMDLAMKLSEQDPIDGWNNSQVFGLQELALSYGHLMSVQEFATRLDEFKGPKDDDTYEVIHLLFKLNALHRCERDLANWLETPYLNQEQVKWLRDNILKCCEMLKRHTVRITDSFFPSNDMIDSMLAPADG